MKMLIVLWQGRGHVVGREELLRRCWGDVIVGDNAIEQAVAALRRLARADTPPIFVIETVPKVGYRLRSNADSSRTDTEPAQVAHSLAAKPSIAVLPFDNLGGDPDQDYFGYGFAEELIAALSRFRELLVLSRSSSFAFGGKAHTPAEIARQTGAQYLLSGSIRTAGRNVRLTAELTTTGDGLQTWSDQYDRDLSDMLIVQDEVARCIAAVVHPAIRGAEVERARRAPLENLSAYDLYLRSLPYIWAGTREGIESAVALLRQSVASDASSATRTAMLSWGLIWRPILGSTEPGSREALTLARRAVTLDTEDAFAQAVCATALVWMAGDWEQGSLHAEEAVRINPSSAFAWSVRGFAAEQSGEFARAIEYYELALRLSPVDSFLYWWLTCLSATHFALEQYGEGIVVARKALQRNPYFGTAHRMLAANLALAGRVEEARQATQERDGVQQTTLAQIRALQIFRQDAVMRRYLTALHICGVPD